MWTSQTCLFDSVALRWRWRITLGWPLGGCLWLLRSRVVGQPFLRSTTRNRRSGRRLPCGLLQRTWCGDLSWRSLEDFFFNVWCEFYSRNAWRRIGTVQLTISLSCCIFDGKDLHGWGKRAELATDGGKQWLGPGLSSVIPLKSIKYQNPQNRYEEMHV